MTLLDWLSTVSHDLTDAGHFVRLELWHATSDGQPARIDTIAIRRVGADGDETALEPESVEQHIRRCAETDVATRIDATGPQRYCVLAYRFDATEAETQFPFLARAPEPPRSVAESLAVGTDPPTDRGALGQIMRMLDTMVRVNVANHESTNGMLRRQLGDSERRREAAEARVLDSIVLQQQLLDRGQERALAAAREEAAARRTEKLLEMFTTIGPVIAAEFVGVRLPESQGRAALLGRAVEGFLSSLSPEQFGAMMSLLREDQRIPFVEIYKAFASAAEARNDERPEPLREVVREPDQKPTLGVKP